MQRAGSNEPKRKMFMRRQSLTKSYTTCIIVSTFIIIVSVSAIFGYLITFSSETVKTETAICSDDSEQYNPMIYGDKIIWIDRRNSNYGIHVYNLNTNTGSTVDTPVSTPYNLVIYEEKIVWQDYRHDNLDIYMYDLSTYMGFTICTADLNQHSPAIYSDRIVWSDGRNGNWDIYMYDLNTHIESPICTAPNSQQFPAIYGDRIVWEDYRNGYADIYMYDLNTHIESSICTAYQHQTFPAIYGDKIVWVDERNGNADIYMYDLNTHIESSICMAHQHQTSPAIYGDRIVWVDERNGNADIYMYDLNTHIESSICMAPNSQQSPAIYGDRIVWVDGRNGNWDIYMDADIDRDGYIGSGDAFPNNPKEWMDTDKDGIGDNSDFLVNFNNNAFYGILSVIIIICVSIIVIFIERKIEGKKATTNESSTLERKINEMRSKGIDTIEEEKILKHAKDMIGGGEDGRGKDRYSQILTLVKHGNKLADEHMQEYQDAVKATAEAQKAIDNSKSRGIGISDIEVLMPKAKEHFDVGDYVKCREVSEEILSNVEHRKEEFGRANSNISSAESLINEYKKNGIKMTSPEKLLQKAKEMQKRHNYNRAYDLAMQGKKAATEIKSLHDDAVKAIESSSTAVSHAESFFDTTQAKQILDDSKEAMKKRDYQQALTLAKKANEIITSTKRLREMASRELINIDNEISALSKYNIDVSEIKELHKKAKELFAEEKYESVLRSADMVREKRREIQQRYKAIDRTIVCLSCGAQVESDATFCTACGAKIDR